MDKETEELRLVEAMETEKKYSRKYKHYVKSAMMISIGTASLVFAIFGLILLTNSNEDFVRWMGGTMLGFGAGGGIACLCISSLYNTKAFKKDRLLVEMEHNYYRQQGMKNYELYSMNKSYETLAREVDELHEMIDKRSN